ncbi:hypothetical protein CTU88_36055 [Streptomyces sp. JV178]|uniref:hypothetical protein n=1 Tax=Streptomyces sp. JV178 TaxID=858632 RepID=UPI000C1B0668|nr:hypothetical protein [Streptomyces sp. JV178]PIM67752.1 hypothetical protein CTU88_36055 [Streptomyces sp. JV178]
MARWDPTTGRWVDDPPAPVNVWRMALVVALAALLGGGAGLGVWTLVGPDGDTKDRTTAAHPSSPTPSPSAPEAGAKGGSDTGQDSSGGADGGTGGFTSGGAGGSGDRSGDGSGDEGGGGGTSGASGGASDDAAPGYVRSEDPAGFTVDVPSGWTRTAKQPEGKPAVVTYESPDGTRVLQLFAVMEESPAASMDDAENANYGFARLPGYRVLDRSEEDVYSEVVYRFDGESGAGPRRVIDHRFLAPDGQPYGVRFSAPESTSLTDLREPVTNAVTSLCPTGATCVRG